jgi:hypothetical protein
MTLIHTLQYGITTDRSNQILFYCTINSTLLGKKGSKVQNNWSIFTVIYIRSY